MIHCLTGRREHVEEEFGFHSPEHMASYDEADGRCLLEDGHEGPHEFTPNDEFRLVFTGEEQH